jgi:hypothetical protein
LVLTFLNDHRGTARVVELTIPADPTWLVPVGYDDLLLLNNHTGFVSLLGQFVANDGSHSDAQQLTWSNVLGLHGRDPGYDHGCNYQGFHFIFSLVHSAELCISLPTPATVEQALRAARARITITAFMLSPR